MYKFKHLEWNEKDGNDIYAAPYGLRWIYYITPINGKFELALIDENCDWNRDLFIFCDTLSDAKNRAKEHYLNVLNSFIINVL